MKRAVLIGRTVGVVLTAALVLASPITAAAAGSMVAAQPAADDVPVVVPVAADPVAPETNVAADPRIATTGTLVAPPPAVPTPPDPAALVAAMNTAFADATAALVTSRVQLTVKALSLTTGESVSSDTGGAYITASIVKVDMVAALLLRAQDGGRGLNGAERSLASLAITESDNDAAQEIFTLIGGRAGLDAANVRLGLAETRTSSSWGLTTTTAADQVRLLVALTNADSVLAAESREYLLHLMGAVEDDQQWGVPAAGAGAAVVKNGWLDYDSDGTWEINSIGVVTAGDQQVLVAVLSRHVRSEAAGHSLVEQAAQLAVTALTRATL